MLLTLPELKTLVTRLEDARRASAAPGEARYCDAPNTDAATGEPYRWEPKPRSYAGATLRDGTRVEAMPDGNPGVKVPLGPHGRAHLGIDPATGAVRCAACDAGADDGKGE
jgi:hypothetical protein